MSASTARPPRGSESGLIGVGTVIGLAIAALFAYLLLGAFEGDSDTFGEVPIPSDSVVDLEQGELDVYYEEGIEGDPEDLTLAVPADLEYAITTEAGVELALEARGGDLEAVEGGAALIVGTTTVPADGSYAVRVTSAQLGGRMSPRLTFGQSPFEAVRQRFDGIVEELNGPTGIVVLAGLLLLFLIPRAGRAVSRARS